MDFVGPLPTTDKNNRYILVVIDLFSRFTRLFATSDKSSETVIDCLTCVFNTFGYPDTLLSDNALEFKSEYMQFFSKIHSIVKKEVLPYSARSNGIVERNNGNIGKLLHLMVNSSSDHYWDSFLSTVENAINNTANVTLGETSSFVLFGYNTYPSLQTNLLGTNYSFHNPCDQIRIRGEIMSRIHENIRNTIINNTEKRNFRQNLHRKEKNIKTGDRVLLRNNQKSNKLDLSWLGPFKVLHVVKNKAILDVKDKQLKVNKVIYYH